MRIPCVIVRCFHFPRKYCGPRCRCNCRRRRRRRRGRYSCASVRAFIAEVLEALRAFGSVGGEHGRNENKIMISRRLRRTHFVLLLIHAGSCGLALLPGLALFGGLHLGWITLRLVRKSKTLWAFGVIFKKCYDARCAPRFPP